MKYLGLLMLMLVLTGCAAGGGVSAGDPAAVIPTFTSLAVQVSTLVPEATKALTATTAPQATTAAAPTATPDLSAGSNPSAVLMPVRNFTECTLTPGWVGCDPAAPPVAGRLAFVDAAGMRVIVLDLERAESWVVNTLPSWMAWSLDGSKLLLAHQSDGGNSYELFRADGTPEEAPATDEELRWQADGTLDSILAVHSPEGDIALLEYSADMRWRMHIQMKDGQKQTLEIEPQPTDRMYQPVTWVPGSNAIIVQRYFPGNSAMLSGTELFTINTETGEQQPLEPMAPIGGAAVFAWQPGETGLRQEPAQLALTVELGGGGRPFTTLALIDFATGQARYPLPEGVRARGPVWMPDGERLVFAALAEPPTGVFTVPGIYETNVQTERVERLTEPTTNLMDDWPQISADGEVLVFARMGSLPSGETRIDIMGKRLLDGFEWVIVRELPIPPTGQLTFPLSRYFGFGMK